MNIKLLTILAFAMLLSACGSGGSSGPTTPVGPEEFSIDYCRVVEVDGRMRLEWAANRPTTGEFRYGQSVYTQLLNVNTLADSHSVGLSGYSFATTYIYRLTAVDAEGNRLDCTGEFLTPEKATPEPIITQLRFQEITESSARVTWQTDEPASTVLHYGIGVAEDSITMASQVMDHEVVLTDLEPSTIYAVRPEAVDADGLRGIGPDSMFATAALLTLWLPSTQINIGDTVLVPVNIEAANDLAALQYSITFAEGNVEIIGITEGPFFDDNDGFNFFRGIQNGDFRVTNTLTWIIEYSGDTRVGTNADGDGVVAYLELRGLAPGSAGAAFDADSTFGLDMFAQARSCSLRTGNITVLP
ncbi:MAG: hypothetical protein KDB65_09510 [Calditrichaeota bacterium]|nr:hypothetical protein [Calditrichota bacterium]MCB9369425.1 hypothetical protein [Calditrichota bacterium]